MEGTLEEFKAALTFINRTTTDKRGHTRAIYQCKCGKLFDSRIDAVKAGKTVSCGCYMILRSTTHSLTKHPLYHRWSAMRGRCCDPSDPAYKNYGGRGITISDEWINDPTNFIKWGEDNGFSPGLELDRRENDKGYSPENCRFVTTKVNCNNRRSNVKVTYNGKTQNVKQLAEELNLNYKLVIQRVEKGWPIEKAILPPTMVRGVCKKTIERAAKRQKRLENAAATIR